MCASGGGGLYPKLTALCVQGGGRERGLYPKLTAVCAEVGGGGAVIS